MMKDNLRTSNTMQGLSNHIHLMAYLVSLLIFFGVLFGSAQAQAWSTTGTMTERRYQHTATLLQNGKVLVAGGYNGSVRVPSAELYDATTGSWIPAASMNYSRMSHTATLLQNGKVLVTGGQSDNYPVPTNSAELYDPSTNTWTLTGGMYYARYAHTATLLPNGDVLVVGGSPNGSTAQATAEIYDPLVGSWTIVNSMNYGRTLHTATLLPNGMVLVVGGYNGDGGIGFLDSAELYDGQWTLTALPLNTKRYEHTATLLSNGKVLVASGANSSGNLVSAEIFDPTLQTWSFTGSLQSPGRNSFTATVIADQKVLVAGGHNGGSSSLDTAEIYDEAMQTWSPTGSLATARYFHTATLLLNGNVLVTGGFREQSGSTLNSAELYRVPDNTPPNISCDAPDGIWHGSDVSITCTANDGGSGLANPADASFSLTTNVSVGVETANASTNSHTVCDVAGNCTTAGPVGGNMVDKKAPTITINAPTNTVYLLNQAVASIYNCNDDGSGLAQCSGPVASGSNIDTASVGVKSFQVTATDNVGNATSQSVSYTIRLPQLTVLGPAQVWLGLKNSDDVGTKFDLLAEVFQNDVMIGSGQLNDVPGGSSGFNNAVLRTVNLTLPASVGVRTGDILSIRLSVRIAASSGHTSGTARLWFDDSAANSRFSATIEGETNNYFLRTGFGISLTTGPGPKSKVDVLVNRNVGGNPFKPFGTWNVTY